MHITRITTFLPLAIRPSSLLLSSHLSHWIITGLRLSPLRDYERLVGRNASLFTKVRKMEFHQTSKSLSQPLSSWDQRFPETLPRCAWTWAETKTRSRLFSAGTVGPGELLFHFKIPPFQKPDYYPLANQQKFTSPKSSLLLLDWRSSQQPEGALGGQSEPLLLQRLLPHIGAVWAQGHRRLCFQCFASLPPC